MNYLFKKTFSFLTLLYLVISSGYAFDRPMEEYHAVISKTPEEATAWKLELIKNAERRIYMMAGYAEGDLHKKALSLFEQILPIKPNLQIWFFASDFPGFITSETLNRLEILTKKYPNQFHFLSRRTSPNYKQDEGVFSTENHAKLLIVDEKYILLGGTNLVDNLSSSDGSAAAGNSSIQGAFTQKGALDQDALLWGATPVALKEDFFRVWGIFEENQPFENSRGPFYPQKSTPPPISEEEKSIIPFFETHPNHIFSVKAKLLMAGPRVNSHEIQNEYAKAIDSAKKEIQLGHLYFFPIPQIYDRLLQAANRNIEIKAMTNGFWKELSLNESTLWLFVQRSRIHYFPLMMGRHFALLESVEARALPQKNVEIFELNEDYTLYHKKTMTVDGVTSLIGSFNFGQKSAFSDYEVLVVINSKEAASAVNAYLAEDRARGTKISRDVAYGWYYNPAYATIGWLEGFFADGKILSMKKPPKPQIVEPSAAEVNDFLQKN